MTTLRKQLEAAIAECTIGYHKISRAIDTLSDVEGLPDYDEFRHGMDRIDEGILAVQISLCDALEALELKVSRAAPATSKPSSPEPEEAELPLRHIINEAIAETTTFERRISSLVDDLRLGGVDVSMGGRPGCIGDGLNDLLSELCHALRASPEADELATQEVTSS